MVLLGFLLDDAQDLALEGGVRVRVAEEMAERVDATEEDRIWSMVATPNSGSRGSSACTALRRSPTREAGSPALRTTRAR